MSGTSRLQVSAGEGARHGCHACGAMIGGVEHCPECRFTGADTMAMFPWPPPEWRPVMDPEGLWGAEELGLIEAARQRMFARFPQFRWVIASVALPPGLDLKAYGFWLFNVCPLAFGETAEERRWAVLLVVDVRAKQAVVVPGYAAECHLSDALCAAALGRMKGAWRHRRRGQAVVDFLTEMADGLESAWAQGDNAGGEAAAR